MVSNIALGAVLLIGPSFLIYLTKKSAALDKIGVVVLCYFVGVLLGSLHLVGLGGPLNSQIVKTFSEVSIAVALPLLLFSMNIPSAFKHAGKALLALFFAALSVTLAAAALYYFFRDTNAAEASHLASMAVGVYTGGTPNLAAIKSALQVPSELYIKFHTYDTVVGLLYLLFVFSFARFLFSKFLPVVESATPDKTATATLDDGTSAQLEGVEDYASLLKTAAWPKLLVAFLSSAAIVGASAGLGSLFSPETGSIIVILSITTLGIIASFITALRRIATSFSLGMYVILVFCISVAAQTDIKALSALDPMVAAFLVGSVFGGMALHSLFCWLAKIDVDTFLIVSVSAICSPPFVPPAAGAINKRHLIPIGLTTGIIGYGIGNYLGVSLHYILR